MRVCVVAPGFKSHGGVPYVARNLANSLGKEEVTSHVLTDAESAADVRATQEDVNVETLGRPNLPFPGDVVVFSMSAARRLRAIHAETPFDLVHVHGQYLLLAPLLNILGRFTPEIPILASAHGTYLNELDAFDQYPSFEGEQRYRIGVRVDQKILDFGCGAADHIHAVASGTEEELVRMGHSRTKITVLPNGINLDRFDRDLNQSMKVSDRETDGHLIVSVGSVVPRKGIHVLVDTAVELDEINGDTTIVHVGGGHTGYSKHVQTRIDCTDAPMRLAGHVPREELLGWLNAADVALSASFSEGCPISLLEAAASGTPTVSTDLGGARDVLGEHGVYVEPGNPEEIAEALSGVLKEPAGRGQLLRNHVANALTWEHLVPSAKDLYETVAREGSP